MLVAFGKLLVYGQRRIGLAVRLIQARQREAQLGLVRAFLDESLERLLRRFRASHLGEELSETQSRVDIVGFGAYQSNSGAWPVIAFSPRKTELVLYVMPGFSRYDELMARLGKCRTGASCLYIKRLSDVDTSVLQELVQSAVTAMEPKRIR